MQQFVYKLLLFSLPILILSFPLDYCISHYLSQSNGYEGEFEVWNDIYNEKANCDIAIYGSSRAWVHVNPKIIEDSLKQTVYNFGIDGHNFWIQYLRHLELIKYDNKPKHIILCLDILTLQKKHELFNPDQFLPYMLWNKNIREYTSSYIGYDKIDYFIPLVRFAGKRRALNTVFKIFINNKNGKKYRYKGFFAMDLKWKSHFDNPSLKLVNYCKLDLDVIKLFERFIKECKKSNIQLIFVYPPEYIDWQRFYFNRNEVMGFYAKFALKYDLLFLDFSKDELCLNKKLFFNENHLNKEGADIFTLKLLRELESTNAITYSTK